jgi:hypothetical protein
MTACLRKLRPVAGAVLLALCAMGAGATDAPVVVDYVVLSNGHPSGREVDTFAGAALDSDFEFNDRGRGPKIHAHYEFDAEGRPRRVDVTGVDYLKARVDEHLATTHEGLAWSSAAEHGSSPSAGFYLSNDGTTSVELAALAHLAATAGPAGVALLPGGIAHAHTLRELEVESHGRKARVRAVSIEGVGFTPSIVWLDADGRFFAAPGSWFAVLRKGWEDTNDLLFHTQTELEDARTRALATELSRHPGRPVAFVGVGLYDAEFARLVPDQTVVVDGASIRAVGPSASVTVPADAERVDGHGRTLLPGLFDLHVHVDAGDGIFHVASGVTSARDMGNDIERLAAVQRSWDEGTAIGPRLWKAGLIDGPGQYHAPTGIFVDSAAAAEAAVNRYADLGYVQIKLYSSLDPKLVPGIVATAHRRGLRVSGHVPDGMIASEFVAAGADELQHINFVFLNFLRGRVADTRTPERFTGPAHYAAGLDLDSAAVNDFVASLVAHRTTVDVTLATFEGMLTGRPGVVSPDYAPIVDRLPVQARRAALHGGLEVTPETDALYRGSYAAFLRMTKKLYDAGVPILAGTDTLAGFMLHRELELEVAAGIPAPKALQNATWVAAGVLGQRATLGSIAVGKRADLLLVEGDPTVRIADIRRGRLVMKDGVMFDPARLYAAIGTAPAP